jgi:hypothetical protein
MNDENAEFAARAAREAENAEFAQRRAMESAAPAPEQPINYLEGYNFPQRMLIGAGKAANDVMQGVGLDGIEGDPGADKAISDDTAGMLGGGLAQGGMMFAGGSGLGAAGAGIKAMSAARIPQAIGSAAQWLGAGAVNPASYKQAAAAGTGFGALSAPGDAATRVGNAAIGGVGGAAGLAVGRGLESVGRAVGNMTRSASSSADIETQITAKLTAKGIDFLALPRAVQEQIKKAGTRSLDVLDDLNPEELARMADFQALNIQPTKGWVTRDPNAWWTENTLNTVDRGIAARFKDANQSLLQSVRTNAPDATDYQLGKRLSDDIAVQDATMKANVDSLYTKARGAAGRDIPLDATRFVNDSSITLDEQMIGSKLPSDTLAWFQKITTGKEPFDMGTAMQRLQSINGLISKTNDPAEATALGIVKTHLINALDDYTPPGGGLLAGQDAEQVALSQAFREARTAAAGRFRFQESNPLIDKVLSGKYTAEQLPDLIGSMRVDDMASMVKLQKDLSVPVMTSLRDAARVFIRDSSTLQGETGGSFTVNGMRKALDKIGPEKGEMLFGAKGWADYQQILRAAGNINNAPLKPAGSSTASNALRVIQKIKIPGIPQSMELLLAGAGRANQTLEVRGLLNPKAAIPRAQPSPSQLAKFGTGGLLTFTGGAAAEEPKQKPIVISRGR